MVNDMWMLSIGSGKQLDPDKEGRWKSTVGCGRRVTLMKTSSPLDEKHLLEAELSRLTIEGMEEKAYRLTDSQGLETGSELLESASLSGRSVLWKKTPTTAGENYHLSDVFPRLDQEKDFSSMRLGTVKNQDDDSWPEDMSRIREGIVSTDVKLLFSNTMEKYINGDVEAQLEAINVLVELMVGQEDEKMVIEGPGMNKTNPVRRSNSVGMNR